MIELFKDESTVLFFLRNAWVIVRSDDLDHTRLPRVPFVVTRVIVIRCRKSVRSALYCLHIIHWNGRINQRTPFMGGGWFRY
jgi:hypothetical protein